MMASESGTIIRVAENSVYVECLSRSACGSCQAKTSCGTSALAKAFPERKQVIKVKTYTEYHPGQQVQLEISDQTLLRSALLVYLLPLVTMLIIALLAQFLIPAETELPVLIGAFFGLGLGFLIARYCRSWVGESGVSIR